MAKYVVGTVKDNPPGSQRAVQVGEISVGLFNVEGSYYAVLNRCPHQGGPLAKGTLVGRLESDCPGEYTYDPHKSFVKCVWHGWEFDLTNGKSWFDPERKRVKPYPVTVEHGDTILHGEKHEVDPRTGKVPGPYVAEVVPTDADPKTGKVPGPYTAEVFPVAVEDDYLVIEVGR